MTLEETIIDAVRTTMRDELRAINVNAPKVDDRLLTADQAAELLQVSPDYLYKHGAKLPFSVVLSRTEKKSVIRFSHNALQKWLERELKLQAARSGK